MTNQENYLNFDLSFLNKKEGATSTTATSSKLFKPDKSKESKSKQFSWLPFLVFGILLLVVLNYLGKNKETTTEKHDYSNTQTNTYQPDQYKTLQTIKKIQK